MFKEKFDIVEIIAYSQAIRTQSFNVVDIVRAIKIIGDNNLISRFRLAKYLELGEGSVRTMIKRMKSLDLIKTIRSGIYLTEKGHKLYAELKNHLKNEFDLPKEIAMKLTDQEYNYCLIVSNLSTKVKKGIEERDTAIRFGANVLITLIQKYGKLFFPDGYEFNDNYKNFSNYLLSREKYEDGDLIIIAGSDNEKGAKSGAYAAFYKLLRK